MVKFEKSGLHLSQSGHLVNQNAGLESHDNKQLNKMAAIFVLWCNTNWQAYLGLFSLLFSDRFDIVRAAEYGDSERVKLLLKEEAHGSVSKYDLGEALVGASCAGLNPVSVTI